MALAVQIFSEGFGTDYKSTAVLPRHVWPKVVMENHTCTPAVHGKSHFQETMETFK